MPSCRWTFLLIIMVFLGLLSPFEACADSIDDEVTPGKPIEPVEPEVAERGFYTVSDASFDRTLLNAAATPDMLRSCMERQLVTHLETTRTRCNLSDEQCARIQFAANGEIVHLVQTVEQLRSAYVGTRQRDERSNSPVLTEIFRRVTIPSMQQFSDSSLFRKAARRQMSDAQWTLYEVLDREQQERAAREAIGFYFGAGRQLSESKEQAMARLFLDRYPRWRPISTHIPFSQYVAARIAVELEAELKEILDEDESLHLRRYASLAKAVEPQLVKLGLWPIPGEPNRLDEAGPVR